MSGAYYNEIDPYAAQWLRNLIAAGHIAPGDVDERSIEDVHPVDLLGYTQCHFFAGIGVWSHALRTAGWPDDRPVWTGSCPCQPFSAAGKGEGTADPRHLWPSWFRLVREHRPVAIFGEQVGAAIRHGWLDLVQADLEGLDYAFGSAVVGAHSVGAPHIRQRLFFVADSHGPRRGARGPGEAGDGRGPARIEPAGLRAVGELADATYGAGQRGEPRATERVIPQGVRPVLAGELADADGWDASAEGLQRGREHGQQPQDGGARRGMADALPAGRPERRPVAGGGSPAGGCGVGVALGDAIEQGLEGLAGHGGDGHEPGRLGEDAARSVAEASGAGFWTACDWLPCIDGKARPTQPIAQQMADGASESLGRLRPAAVEEITKEVADAYPTEDDARKAVFALRKAIAAKAMEQRSVRGFLGVQQAPVLFAFLLQLQKQGWSLSEGLPRSGKKEAWRELRGVRHDEAAACPSCQRGLDEQRGLECSNPVHLLSSILARHAQANWGEAIDANAKIAFPLIVNATSRVGRLRAYGNAIVAPVAAEFVRAYQEARP